MNMRKLLVVSTLTISACLAGSAMAHGDFDRREYQSRHHYYDARPHHRHGRGYDYDRRYREPEHGPRRHSHHHRYERDRYDSWYGIHLFFGG